jgi:hypothetical protein
VIEFYHSAWCHAPSRVIAGLYVAAAVLLELSGCAGQQPTPPPQPTATYVEAALADLAQINATPLEAWRAGNGAVRAACYAYLNQAATRNASIGLGSSAAGVLGAGLSVVNPLAGVASSLFQTFLTALQSSGAIPYTTETSTIIVSALNAEESAVEASPPVDVAQAISYVEDQWFNCTAGWYQILVTKSIATAQIGTTSSPSFSSFQSRAVGAPIAGRPAITVNGR